MPGLGRVTAGLLLVLAVSGCVVREGSAPQPEPRLPEIERKAPEPSDEARPEDVTVT